MAGRREDDGARPQAGLGGRRGDLPSARSSGGGTGSVLVPAAGWRVAPDGGRAQLRSCRHLDDETLPAGRIAVTGCAECLAAGREDWVHLRVCLRCGHNGCCDSSPGTHAYRHAALTGHPLAVAAERSWAWCYTDEVFLIPAEGRGAELQ